MKKFVIYSILLCFLVAAALGGVAYSAVSKFKHLFALNKLRQEQGYYTAEFEFKLLGIGYCFDKGEYSRASHLFSSLLDEMETTEGMVKLPEFDNAEEELDFYLNLQNPVTGAFMDEAYPFSSYHGPTENILIHMGRLAEKAGKPLKLKYPLKYLDRINTPEKLKAYFDDISTVGFIASKFPQTTFHNVRDLVNLVDEYQGDDEKKVIQKYGLYHFSDDWREALLQWLYGWQDVETGLWGPKSASGNLRKKDLSNTVSIVKIFVDDNGDDVFPEYPLRYRHQLIQSAIDKMSVPVPDSSDIGKIHEWDLVMTKTIKMLTRYLMKNAELEDKIKIRELVDSFIKIKFDKFYSETEGAFRHYPGEGKATLDGTAFFFIFKDIGAFSARRQRELWNGGVESAADFGSLEVDSPDVIAEVVSVIEGNSVRVYSGYPDLEDTVSGVELIGYQSDADVPDVIQLTAKVRQWLKHSEQTMGNWVSKADLIERMGGLDVPEIKTSDDLAEDMFRLLQEKKLITAVFFDRMQIPVSRIVFTVDSH